MWCAYIVDDGDLAQMKSTATKRLLGANVIAAILLSACTPPVEAWQRSELVGYRYELNHPETLQQFSFDANGDVIANIGQRDGPVAGPILNWELTTNGVLVIKDHDQRIHYSFSKISLNLKKATVLSSGKKQVWLRSKI
jgi:hypothetical protein